jgi:hypothetical protein
MDNNKALLLLNVYLNNKNKTFQLIIELDMALL